MDQVAAPLDAAIEAVGQQWEYTYLPELTAFVKQVCRPGIELSTLTPQVTKEIRRAAGNVLCMHPQCDWFKGSLSNFAQGTLCPVTPEDIESATKALEAIKPPFEPVKGSDAGIHVDRAAALVLLAVACWPHATSKPRANKLFALVATWLRAEDPIYVDVTRVLEHFDLGAFERLHAAPPSEPTTKRKRLEGDDPERSPFDYTDALESAVNDITEQLPNQPGVANLKDLIKVFFANLRGDSTSTVVDINPYHLDAGIMNAATAALGKYFPSWKFLHDDLAKAADNDLLKQRLKMVKPEPGDPQAIDLFQQAFDSAVALILLNYAWGNTDDYDWAVTKLRHACSPYDGMPKYISPTFLQIYNSRAVNPCALPI